MIDVTSDAKPDIDSYNPSRLIEHKSIYIHEF